MATRNGALVVSNVELLPNRDDEFFIHAYKVIACPLKQKHNWQACYFGHPNEAAARRPPSTYLSICCPNSKQRKPCAQGNKCPFAHSIWEYWLHPSRYRTVLCSNAGRCTRAVCFFAHSPEELRNPPEVHPAVNCNPQQLQLLAKAGRSTTIRRVGVAQVGPSYGPPGFPIDQLNQPTPVGYGTTAYDAAGDMHDLAAQNWPAVYGYGGGAGGYSQAVPPPAYQQMFGYGADMAAGSPPDAPNVQYVAMLTNATADAAAGSAAAGSLLSGSGGCTESSRTSTFDVGSSGSSLSENYWATATPVNSMPNGSPPYLDSSGGGYLGYDGGMAAHAGVDAANTYMRGILGQLIGNAGGGAHVMSH